MVPVFNTGKYIEELIASLAAQSLSQHEFEVIFVDDGSTDDTPHRLDRLAAEQENVIVLHEPNSGWAGRPRNRGIDSARGEYVFFVDHDDWLGAEALERMSEFAADNNSDIVIGRQAGHHRGVAKPLFAKTLPAATLETAPLMDSLTPHMMFRKAFLDRHGLRFPEGRRRLEDHVFVTEAYFLAEGISILADYHCYFHVRRDDGGNAAYQRIDPAAYFGNVREVVDVVLANTTPGPVRDLVLGRSVRGELLGRLDGRHFLDQDLDYRRQLFDQARAVLVETMPPSVDAALPPAQRSRATLLREDRFEDLSAYVRHDLRMTLDVHLLDLCWDEDGSLHMEVAGLLVDRTDGRPWRYQRDGGSAFLPRPDTVRRPLPPHIIDCTEALRHAHLQIALRRREDSEEWIVPVASSFELHEDDNHAWMSYQVTSRIDPLTLGGGRTLTPGIWDAYGRVTQTGWVRETRIGANRGPQATSGARAALLSGQLMVPYWTEPHGNLSLDVRANPNRLVRQMHTDPHPVSVVDHPHRRSIVQVSVPLVLPPGPVVPATLRLTQESSRPPIDIDARGVRESPTEVSVSATAPKLPPGQWEVSFALDVQQWGSFQPTGASLAISRRGRVTVKGPGVRATRAPVRLRGACRWVRRGVRRLLRLSLATLHRRTGR